MESLKTEEARLVERAEAINQKYPMVELTVSPSNYWSNNKQVYGHFQIQQHSQFTNATSTTGNFYSTWSWLNGFETALTMLGIKPVV